MESGNSDEGAIKEIGKGQKLFLAAVLRGGIKVEIELEVTLKDRCAYHLPGEVDMSWPE